MNTEIMMNENDFVEPTMDQIDWKTACKEAIGSLCDGKEQSKIPKDDMKVQLNSNTKNIKVYYFFP